MAGPQAKAPINHPEALLQGHLRGGARGGYMREARQVQLSCRDCIKGLDVGQREADVSVWLPPLLAPRASSWEELDVEQKGVRKTENFLICHCLLLLSPCKSKGYCVPLASTLLSKHTG